MGMTREEIIADEKYHTCGRCRWGDLNDDFYPCNKCIHSVDKREDFWQYAEYEVVEDGNDDNGKQASAIQEAKQKALVEACDSFKKDYKNHLKAAMTAMLTELQLEIEELKSYESADGQDLVMLADIGILFQQKINALKENEDGNVD